MVPVAEYEKRLRPNADLTSESKLVLLEILDLDDIVSDGITARPPLRLTIRLLASGCGLNDVRTLLAMRELERLGLIAVTHVGGQLDLRVDLRYDAIDALLGVGHAVDGGRVESA